MIFSFFALNKFSIQSTDSKVLNTISQQKSHYKFQETKTGECGDTVSWSLNASLLYIYGTGDMTQIPWSSYAKYIRSVLIDEGVTSIADKAFSGCTKLTSVTLPNSLSSIGDSAFDTCSNLKSITIPDSVTILGEYVFNGCHALTSITLPNDIQILLVNSFAYCYNLTSITLPSSLSSIRMGVFIYLLFFINLN